MKRTVLLFGLLSGAISATAMATACMIRGVSLRMGAVIGWTSIVLAGLVVFFGVRSYREREGGSVTFGRAFAVGALITVVASALYAATWTTLSLWLVPSLPRQIATAMVEEARADGKSDAEILKAKERAEAFVKMEQNPLINVGEAFAEPFPVGLLAALLAAAVLRRKPEGAPGGASGASAALT